MLDPHTYLIFSKQELELLIPLVEMKKQFCTDSEVNICDAILFGLKRALRRYEEIDKTDLLPNENRLLSSETTDY